MSSGVDQELSAALQLGWRVAELYAQVNDFGEPSNDTLLPASGSLEPEDQLELQLRAAVGDARRAGLEAEDEAFEELVALAREAPRSSAHAKRFRERVRRCHIELSKSLWARDEASGKAYELGNGVSDTYSRVRRSYSEETREEEPAAVWKDVFEKGRIERLKRLLDDLQSRLDTRGAAVVRQHLDVWCAEVAKRIDAGGTPEEDAVRKGLRRQTIIWRQLIAGDKEPEAYLDSKARADLRDDLRWLALSRCWRWVAAGAVLLFALVAFWSDIAGWYEGSGLGKAAASAVIAVAGAFGITKASLAVTVRARIHQWSELLWDRAIANRVCAETLVLESVLPAPARKCHRFGALASSVGDGFRDRVATGPAPQERAGTTP